MKKAPSSLTTFGMPKQRNRVDYLSGDIFDPGAWSKLAGRQFNLVFSDAFHSADALRTEADAILSHGLLHPDEVVVVWDDLNGEMADAFRAICGRFAAARHGCRSTSFVVPLKGWLGNNWDDHPVGFFVSLRR